MGIKSQYCLILNNLTASLSGSLSKQAVKLAMTLDITHFYVRSYRS